MVYHNVQPVNTWSTKELNAVLEHGDVLYTTLRESGCISDPTTNKYLLVSELPPEVDLNQSTFQCQYSYDLFQGNLSKGGYVVPGFDVSLLEGLNLVFGKHNTCFVTTCGITFAIIGHNTEYFFVDSHAHASGYSEENGRSIVLAFGRLNEVCSHIQRLFSNVTGQKRFELSGVSVTLHAKDARPQKAEWQEVNDKGKTNLLHDDVNNCCAVAKGDDVVCLGQLDSQGTSQCLFNAKWCSEMVIDIASDVVGESDVECVEKLSTGSTADLICIDELPSIAKYFRPVCGEAAQNICDMIKVELQRNVEEVSSPECYLGLPCQTYTIVGDGSCFFRAVSHAVSGSQDNHKRFRFAVVKYLKENQEQCKQYLREQYTSVLDYITTSGMQYVKTWATEVEIQAMANLLHVDIYTYCEQKWLVYKCFDSTNETPGVYVEHCNANHYNVVMCVKNINEQKCSRHCQQIDKGEQCQTRQLRSGRKACDDGFKAQLYCENEKDVCPPVRNVEKLKTCDKSKDYYAKKKALP